MKLTKIIFKSLGLFVLVLMILLLVWWVWPARTPKIHSKNNTVSAIDYVKIGGIEQCVLIRGENTDNPVLLFLHGGPGMPMMYLAHQFQRPLEKHFTVVQWDRRGAGKTYSKNIPSPESINTEQLIKDAFTLTDTLRKRYKQEKIILAGHSFGSYLGSIMVNQRPELFKAYISIGQVVDHKKSRIIQENFIRKQAIKAKRGDIISVLDSVENPNLENWLFEFGGELKNSTSFFPLLWTGLKAPEYRLKEALNVAKGSSFSSRNMKYNMLAGSIANEIRDYQVPVYFFVGKSDYTTPYELIQEYYEMITAPKKGIVYFENSAHFPFFEEPDKFCNEIIGLFVK